MRKVLPLAALLLSCGVGRKSVGEFKLNAEPASGGPAFSRALYQSVGVELKPGNAIEVVNNGAVFDRAIADIARAQSSVHIETFIWADGRVSDRLIEALSARAKKARVQCRVIVDAVGSMKFADIQKRLEEGGCEVHKIRPLPGQDDLARMHRKIMIIDGRIAYTGGFGIDDKWMGHGHSDDPPEWRDSNLRVRGPAVKGMQQAFAENWQEAGGKLLPAEAFPDEPQPGHAAAGFVTSTDHGVVTKGDRLTQLFIAAAKKRVWISNAYFVPSTPILELLERKAREGVDVRVLAAGDKTDTPAYLKTQRERMDQLVKAGARAYEYEPAMMHGKTMLVDDSLVSVGSCNLDALSLNKLDEGALVVDDPRVAQEEERHFLEDVSHSRQRLGAQTAQR